VQAALRSDAEAGLLPAFLCLTIGTTSSTAIDDVAAIAAWVSKEFPSVWIHIDAAYAGSFAALPSHRPLFAGVELVDSLSFNPHKSLLVAFDCTCFFVRHRRALLRALSFSSDPAYLRNAATASGSVIDLKDWQLPFGRRFRSLKLWFTLRSFGARGVRRHLSSAIANATRFKEHIAATNGRYRLVCEPAHFGLVCFQLVHPAEEDCCPADKGFCAGTPAATLEQRNELNELLKERATASGSIFFVTTVLSGESVCRLACNGEVQHGLTDIDRAWAVIEQHRQAIWAERGWTKQ